MSDVTAAPGAATPGPNLRANGEAQHDRADDFLSPRTMQKAAATILAARGLEIHPGTIRRLVTRFIQDGVTTLAELEARIISYADPTGESAVRNVMKENGGSSHV